uniref:Uncharacterized protein n=1 Tax=viral metagenome TaxID=1070528 RepID=A0A6C0BI08_9ZZZZ
MSTERVHETCELPFWKDPMVLFRHFNLQYQPTCIHSTWNFIMRILLISFFVGLVASVLGGLSALFVALVFGSMTAAAIILLSKTPQKQNVFPDPYRSIPFETTVEPTGYTAPIKERFEEVTEHFVNGGSSAGSVQPYLPSGPSGVVEVDAFPYKGQPLPERTLPTSRNPFMNVLLGEMKYNPSRPEAAPINQPSVKQTIDDYFRVQWFSDPTDVFGKNQSQRQFVTQPSTTVPNDQGSFANWLYRIPGKTCKEGGRAACLSGTDGGPIPWLNQAS